MKARHYLIPALCVLAFIGNSKKTGLERDFLEYQQKATNNSIFHAKYPDDYFFRETGQDKADVYQRNFPRAISELTSHLSSIDANDPANKDEVLRTKILLTEGLYSWSMISGGGSDRSKMAEVLAKQIWDADPNYAISNNTVYSLSGHKQKPKEEIGFRCEAISCPTLACSPKYSRIEELVNKPAPEISGFWINQPRLFVNKTPLESYRLDGKVVMLDFWALDCGPCVREMPVLEEIWQKYKDKGLVVIGVHAGDKKGHLHKEEIAKIEEFARDKKLTFPILFDDNLSFVNYGIMAFPQQVIIDKKGIVRGSEERKEVTIEKLLNE